MQKMRKGQAGKSKVGNLFFFVALAYGIFLAFQYVPQRLEWATVQTILEQVQQQHYAYRVTTPEEAWKQIDKQLAVNDMKDMRENFEVTKPEQWVIIDVHYQRELNLIFTTMRPTFRQTIELGKVESLAY